jgi:hypothetical protein
MLPPLSPPRHQPRSLQRFLHPGVAQLNVVFLAEFSRESSAYSNRNITP